jgi:hypothetical protein
MRKIHKEILEHMTRALFTEPVAVEVVKVMLGQQEIVDALAVNRSTYLCYVGREEWVIGTPMPDEKSPLAPLPPGVVEVEIADTRTPEPCADFVSVAADALGEMAIDICHATITSETSDRLKRHSELTLVMN